MTTAAFRLALQQWVRFPREMGLANAAVFLALFLPMVGLAGLPASGLRWAALAAWALWAWMCFAWLCAACARIGDGTEQPLKRSRGWIRGQWPERLAAAGLAGLLAAWWALSLRFYLSSAMPAWAALPMMAALGAFGVWMAAALLLSQALAAEGGRPWASVWKASALLPLAYAPQALALLVVFGLACGAPVLLTGLTHWSARLFLAPLLLAPFFTIAFLAAFLVSLSRGLLDAVQGSGPKDGPSWREIWSPWR